MADRIIVALTFSTRGGGGLVPDPAHDSPGSCGQPPDLAGKRVILNKCLESARQSGADCIALVSAGNLARLLGWTELSDLLVIGGGPDPNMQEGELNNIRRAAAFARAGGFDWVFKVCADVFHPHPGWARRVVAQARPGSGLVAGIIDEGGVGAVVTRVFAGRPDFILATHPTTIKATDAGEVNWRDGINALGLHNQWTIQPSMICGHPLDPTIRYLHTHTPGEALAWRMEQSDSGKHFCAFPAICPPRTETAHA
jgi:hypothetical protein